MVATKPIRALGLFVLLCVSLSLFGEFSHHSTLIHIFKPLATILILVLPLAQWLRSRSPYGLYISIGLLFSLFGDIFLMFPLHFFIHGLFAFLLAHIAYLIAFSRDVKFPARSSIWLLYLLVVLSFFIFLLPTLPSSLRIPVLIYIFFVSTMAAQAMGRFLILKNNPARNAAIGTLLFILSDSLLSFERFHSSIPVAYLFILTSYYLAQWLIAVSTLPAPLSRQSSS